MKSLEYSHKPKENNNHYDTYICRSRRREVHGYEEGVLLEIFFLKGYLSNEKKEYCVATCVEYGN